ncbi:Aromatic-ring hydroxylase [Cordyceps militaris]|uniref:Phospho-2-dehydro-3-deoxyheptonate aldolase n=1 Tax=Cordyceps militaris TaxID=73501 RepID=A0A2H4SRY9_CORMI|nr:Aromatic-ring hydroxylase [Cordyceps militaris]
METIRDDFQGSDRRAVKALNIIIVGAGIGGLTAGIALAHTGHCVTIFETVSEITDVGAGIQIAPNAARILHRLDVLRDVMDHATVLERVSIRRYTSDEEMATFPLMPANGLKYGAPMGVIHRGDLQNILLNKALELGCHIFTNHKVIAVDPKFSAKVHVHDGTTGARFWLSANMVIAADGVKSHIRQQIMTSKGYKDEPIPTGDAAYRLLIPRNRVLDDPLTLSMMDKNVAMRYMGPGGHIMAYPIRGNSLYNIVLLHPAKSETLSEDVWTSKGSREDMLKFCAGWSPAVQKWLAHADEDVPEWNLYVYPDLPTWTQGNVALLGDACHPMLPYVAQGAANAMEDAAVLATALTCTSNVRLALKMYETIRKSRAEKIAASATATAYTLHMPDGPEQIARDQGLVSPGAAKHNPDKWSNVEWQDFMWGVDVTEVTIRMWMELAKVLSLEKRYPHFTRAYTYTLFVDISRVWLLKQLHSAMGNRSRNARYKAGREGCKMAKSKKARIVCSGGDIKSMMQNPRSKDEQTLASVTGKLTRLPVHTRQIGDVKSQLGDAAQGDSVVLRAGDSADILNNCQKDAIESKMKPMKPLHQLRKIVTRGFRKSVICIERIAGQYAKLRPRSSEKMKNEAVRSFRGDILKDMLV